ASLLLFWQVQKLQDYYYTRVEVSIFLKPNVTDDQRSALRTDLESDPLVDRAIYESKEVAYARFKNEFRDAPDLVNATKPDSLPESFRVKLKDPKQFQLISDKYRTREGINDIVDQRRLLAKLFDILGALKNLALVVGIVQGAAALLLVANTIQV